MDERDRSILRMIQESFPLIPDPFRAIGEMAGLSEDFCLERIKALKGRGIIREISGIFESRRLGYRSTLVAMKVRSDDIERAAWIVNSHPGVSHNYERNHEYNIWFTLTIPSESNLEETVGRLSKLSGAEGVRIFPNLRLFKIGVILDLDEGGMTGSEPGLMKREALRIEPNGEGISEEDRLLVKILQKDLPLVPAPFIDLSKEAGMEEQAFLKKAQALKERGIMRRYAATLRHREAGFLANAMGVWIVPEERIEEVGRKMAAFRAVTHCYQRPTYPDWPYNIFTMIHARTKEECESIIKAISKETGIKDYRALFSTREFKKQRVRYFTGEIEDWERKWLTDDAAKKEGRAFGS